MQVVDENSYKDPYLLEQELGEEEHKLNDIFAKLEEERESREDGMKESENEILVKTVEGFFHKIRSNLKGVSKIVDHVR